MTDKNTDQHTDDSPEFDQVLSSFEKAESQRRKKGIIYALIGLMIAAGLFLLAFVFRNEVFGPPVDIEAGEEEILAKTDDPQCRDMIAQVQQLSDRYFKFEPSVDEKLLGDDPEAIQKIRDEIARLQQRVDEIQEFSQQANLRFDESRQELEAWFEYVKVELSFLDRLAEERLAELKDDAAGAKDGDTSTASKGEAAEEGAEKEGAEQEGVVVDKGKDSAEKEEKAASQKTPKERKEGALIALHDAFQKFRVWHSSSAHPCGEADEGEEPWRPKKSGDDSQASAPAE